MSPTNAMMLVAPAAGGGGAGFKTITVDHTKVGASDSSNFPMLFSYTNANLKTIANGGQVGNVNDISFATTSGGAVDLVWDDPILDATTGKFTAVVKIPTLSHTSDTVIYLRWDGTGRGSTQAGTFGATYDANFTGVFKGSNDGTNRVDTDYTSNGNSLTVGTNISGAADDYRAAAVIGGSPNWHIVDGAFPATSGGTIMARIKPTGGSGTRAAVSCGNGSKSTLTLWLDTNTKLVAVVTQSTVHKDATSTSTISTGGSYTTAHGVYDNTNTYVYVNGSLEATTSAPGGADSTIGSSGGKVGSFDSSLPWTGNIGEIRISKIARSADWILAEHNNFSSPSTFYSVT